MTLRAVFSLTLDPYKQECASALKSVNNNLSEETETRTQQGLSDIAGTLRVRLSTLFDRTTSPGSDSDHTPDTSQSGSGHNPGTSSTGTGRGSRGHGQRKVRDKLAPHRAVSGVQIRTSLLTRLRALIGLTLIIIAIGTAIAGFTLLVIASGRILLEILAGG